MGTDTSMDLNAKRPTLGDINMITDTHIDRCTYKTYIQAHLDQNINPHTDTWRLSHT
jgi:hypothetical protein